MHEHTDPTIAAYNQYAQLYDQEVIEFWENFPKEFMQQFKDDSPGPKVLNVGSGSGRDALLIKNMGLEVVCADASKHMVEITTQMGFSSHNVDFEHMAFPEKSYDGVWAYTSLIHVPKEEAVQAIQKIRSYLKDKGIFAIGVIEGDNAGMVERKTMPGALRYFKNYSSQELIDMIEPLGFRFMTENRYQPHNNIYINQLYRAA